jgi:formylmethanofuran dehydrogenase subunit B
MLSTDQVTLVLAEPLTVAENCCVPLGARLAEAGLIVIDIAVTVTLALADLVVSAALVAVTVCGPAVLGAV